MKVRKAQQQDLPALNLLFEAYRQFYKQAADSEASTAFLQQRLAAKDSVIFVAEGGAQSSESQLLGFTQLYPSFSSVSLQRLWILNDLFVAPKARQRGVAQALMEAANQWAHATNSKGLLLETDWDNVQAQRLYDKLGYVKQDSTYHYFLPATGTTQKKSNNP